jgi:hypothetical protein
MLTQLSARPHAKRCLHLLKAHIEAALVHLPHDAPVAVARVPLDADLLARPTRCCLTRTRWLASIQVHRYP